MNTADLQMMSAPEVAELLGVHADVIRRLPADGGVPPAKRLAGRFRYYTAQDVERIRAALVAAGCFRRSTPRPVRPGKP
jgi:hypothetical protein